MSLCQIKITKELAEAHSKQALAAQRDNSEIRDLILELRSSFTQYIQNQDVQVPVNSEAFQTVVQDIEEVCQSTGHHHNSGQHSSRKSTKLNPMPLHKTPIQKYVQGW
jgi:hypothetical protein